MAQEKGISKAQGFTHGMVSDPDPRFQIKGSYSNALNIRLSNDAGDTFTVENIKGNTLFIDLYALTQQIGLESGGEEGILGTRDDVADGTEYSEIYWDPTNTDASSNPVGPLFPSPNNPGTSGEEDGVFPFGSTASAKDYEYTSSIVGYTSFGNEMILIIVVRDDIGAHRTVFLQLKYDENMNVESVTDLGVCYSNQGDNYPDLGMELDMPVKVVSLIENNCLKRIYWTDNKNPLRTLNVNQPAKNQLPPETLDITPLADMSQPVMSGALHGSLPVGQFQYLYKYISANGGETTFSPASNLYHTSDQGFGSSSLYGGGPSGKTGTQGFNITIHDLDNNYEFVELYALLYEGLNQVPKLCLVDRKRCINLDEISFSHVAWSNELEGGIDEILIQTNTWTHCKDIAIKDNILFAANLKQKTNHISDKEWNVKVLRYKVRDGADWTSEDGMLTTTDTEIKHYDGANDLSSSTHGTLEGGDESQPNWATLEYQRDVTGGGLNGKVKKNKEYRFLRDGMTLGGESYNYESNSIGGCRVSFGLEKKVADATTNDGVKPYISSTSLNDSIQTDNIAMDSNGVISTNTDTVYSASMPLGGSKDPHLAGDKRGYQRGEIYRFGVQVYDKTGTPGNVLWIGDIQTPEMYDLNRYIDTSDAAYNPIYSSSALAGLNVIKSDKLIQDYRLSYIYGHNVPWIDVSWFSGRLSFAATTPQAYVDLDGLQIANTYNPAIVQAGSRYAKWLNFNPAPSLHDDKHYLFDLYVNFEFIIPNAVREKISGFRVVRSERTETDRRVMQQGLLNQTMKYGKNGGYLSGREKGYQDGIDFSLKDNENLDDDEIFTNSYDPDTPTDVIQPEYDSYLNGYIGLAENNHIGFWKASNDGTLTLGGYTEGKAIAIPDEELLPHNHIYSQTQNYIDLETYVTSTAANKGPGAPGNRTNSSAIFGSYEKSQKLNWTSPAGINPNRHYWVPEHIFTLDCPDSAFGSRPYIFQEEDRLRIDVLLKLSDEDRYQNDANGVMARQYGYFAASNTQLTAASPDQWAPESDDKTIDEAFRFGSIKEQDKDKKNGRLIGKYYCYDTYWGVGMETEGGKGYANDWAVNNMAAEPLLDYVHSKQIKVAKELNDGEIVPASFFKDEESMTNGHYAGFSNNTLGFISEQNRGYAKWGALNNDITAIGSYDSILEVPEQKEQDLNYHTMSTMQMGLRSILLETDGSPYQFHPRNLSNILTNQSWKSRNASGAINSSTVNNYYLGGHNDGKQKRLIPFKYLCSIVRRSIAYGGSSKSSIEATRYIPCGNFHPITTTENSMHGAVSKAFGGDTFVNLYSHQKTSGPYMRNSYSRWQVFPVESFVNTDMRSGLTLNAGDTELGNTLENPPFSNDWLYNNVYSQENNLKSGIMMDEDATCESVDLPYEIAYSETKLLGEQGDAFRTFPLNNFHDMEGAYGEINKLVNFKNDLYVLQDEAFAKLLVNPISMITDDTGSSLFTGTGDTVENHIYISTKFGTRHSTSVTTSEDALYYIDSRYARILKYDSEKLISLGDSLGQRNALRTLIKDLYQLDSFNKEGRQYLSDNTLKFLGIQSIFDHKNKELIVTFHNSDKENQVSSTLVFNEGLNAFSSYYTAIPSLWIDADPAILSTSNEISASESVDGYSGSKRQGSLKLWQWDTNDERCTFWGESGYPHMSYIEKVINDHADQNKVFDNGRIVMTPDATTLTTATISFATENNLNQTIQSTFGPSRYKEGILRFPLRLPTSTTGRMRGTWLKIRFTAATSTKFNIFAILAKYRKSYN